MTNFTLGMLFTIVLIFVSISSGVWWISWRNGKALEPSKVLKSKKMSKKEVKKYMEEWKDVHPTVVPNDVPHVVNREWFVDSYKMEWLLRDETGKEWCEYHNQISLSDFEIIYGNNVHEIVMVEMRLMDHV